MRSRTWIWVAALALTLIPAAATAGGGGHITMARPVERVAQGKVAIYLQALQHDVHPVDDAKVTVVGTAPGGKTVTVSGAMDPSYGTDHVYVVHLPLGQTGLWKLTVTAESQIYFPPLDLQVDVVREGTKLPDPGPVRPYQAATGDGHAHSQGPAASQPQATQAASQPVPPQPAPQTGDEPVSPVRWALPLVAVVALAGAGFLFWVRQRPASRSLSS